MEQLFPISIFVILVLWFTRSKIESTYAKFSDYSYRMKAKKNRMKKAKESKFEISKIKDEAFEEYADENGHVKIPFDKAMFIIRNFKERNVISEDGKVFLGGISKGIGEEKEIITHQTIPAGQNATTQILEEDYVSGPVFSNSEDSKIDFPENIKREDEDLCKYDSVENFEDGSSRVTLDGVEYIVNGNLIELVNKPDKNKKQNQQEEHSSDKKQDKLISRIVDAIELIGITHAERKDSGLELLINEVLTKEEKSNQDTLVINKNPQDKSSLKNLFSNSVVEEYKILNDTRNEDVRTQSPIDIPAAKNTEVQNQSVVNVSEKNIADVRTQSPLSLMLMEKSKNKFTESIQALNNDDKQRKPRRKKSKKEEDAFRDSLPKLFSEVVTDGTLLGFEDLESYDRNAFEKFTEESIYDTFTDKDKNRAAVLKIFDITKHSNEKPIFYLDEVQKLLYVEQDYFINSLFSGINNKISEDEKINILSEPTNFKLGLILESLNNGCKSFNTLNFKIHRVGVKYMLNKTLEFLIKRNGMEENFSVKALRVNLRNIREDTLDIFLDNLRETEAPKLIN